MILRSIDKTDSRPPMTNDVTAKSKAFVTPLQLATYLDVHPQTIYRQIRKGALRVVRVGRVIRIRLADALRYASPSDSGNSDDLSSGNPVELPDSDQTLPAVRRQGHHDRDTRAARDSSPASNGHQATRHNAGGRRRY